MSDRISGDYIDRAPEDCGEGSDANALYLPRVGRAIPRDAYPSFKGISMRPSGDFGGAFRTTCRRKSTSYGVRAGSIQPNRGSARAGAPRGRQPRSAAYLAHAGFPRGKLPAEWREAFDHLDDDRLAEIVWVRRAALAESLRRHRAFFGSATSPDSSPPVGPPSCSAAMMRISPADRSFTTVVSPYTPRGWYEHFGGVLFARLPLDHPLRSTQDVLLEHVETEGRDYPLA